MKNPCPYSWKKCNFAHKLCENGLHLGKKQAFCTRFAPFLSHAFFEYIFLLLNFSAIKYLVEDGRYDYIETGS